MGNPGAHGAAVGGGADSGDDQPLQHRPRRLRADLPAGGRLQPFRLKTPRPFATGHVSWPHSSVGVLFLVPGRFPVTSGTQCATIFPGTSQLCACAIVPAAREEKVESRPREKSFLPITVGHPSRRQPLFLLSTHYSLPLCVRPFFLPGKMVAHWHTPGGFLHVFAFICIFFHLFAFIFHLFPFFCCFFSLDGVY